MEENSGFGALVPDTANDTPENAADSITPTSSKPSGISPQSWFNAGQSLANMAIQQLLYMYNRGKEQEYAKDMFDYEHQANIDDWRMANQYNLPINQLQRYTDAGMSPAAAMAAIGGFDNQSGVPNAAAASVGAGYAPSAQFQPVRMMLQDDEIRSQIMLNSAMADKNNADTYRIYQITPAEVENLQARTLRQHSEVEVNEQLKNKYYQETQRISKLTPLEVDKLKEQINDLKATILEKKQAIENMKQQIEESKARVSNLNANTELQYTEQQGQVWQNYSAMVKAFKDDVTRKLVDTFNVNPDDPLYHQMVESSLDNNTLVDYLSALNEFSEGLGQFAKEETPTWLKAAGIYYLMQKLNKDYDNGVHRKVGNLKDVVELLLEFASFKGSSVPNPIGF